ncbi:unnamed protein product [Oppiella nova]|uniref:Cyclin-like domain-containing protein n=1 Tax=Oppiella nova TaxID=334625 RepID=A0A7R9M3D6_9ACAR|nr:unnamed protein product [Oppiella nova]CAG2170003.1 unnamed protein product [Oppiella nova]
MFSTSTQLKHWMYGSEEELNQLRTEANQRFIRHRVTDDLDDVYDKYLSPAEEAVHTKHYESILRDFCRKFSPPMPKSVVGTAFQYFKRFYLNNSVMDFHPKHIIVTCVYLAAKVEEFNVSMQQFVANVKGDRAKATDVILNNELLLMQQLRYHLNTRYPQCGDPEKLRQNIDSFIDLSLSTDACFLFSPSQIALSAVVYAASKLEINLDPSNEIKQLQKVMRSNDENNELWSMITSVSTPQREQVRAIEQKLELCRNQSNNPDSKEYQRSLDEEMGEETVPFEQYARICQEQERSDQKLIETTGIDNSSPKNINWAQYGLDTNSSHEQRTGLESGADTSHLMQGLAHNELFLEDQASFGKQWWKSNFFLSQPILFGTWDGVYTSCVIHLFGVITFLRAGWLVGNAGIGFAILIILSSVVICCVAVLAAIGICERSNRGNVHALISTVLGSRIGAAVCIIYSFGQAVSCALHVMGFAETLSQLLNANDIWVERGIGVGLVVLLLSINVLGVKWVIRLQFILLFFLFLSAIDFVVGVFIRYDPNNGVIGYSIKNIENNWEPNENEPKVSLFNAFGVFFPAVTGVMAGINMSGDLHKPGKSIPIGTFSAIGTSLFLYLSFALGLGATCLRSALLTDYMIAQKASSVGVFLLLGLYISALSYSLGSLYATPRIIQNIANENIIPVMRFLAVGRGPNKVPVNALILFSIVIFIFIMIVGRFRVLKYCDSPGKTHLFPTVEYAYFSLAMTFDIQINRESRFMASAEVTSPTFDTSFKNKSSKHSDYGSVKSNDLDRLFPERVQTKHIKVKRQVSSQSSSRSSSQDRSVQPPKGPADTTHDNSGSSSADESFDSTDSSVGQEPRGDPNEIKSKQNVWYSCLINRWIIIMGAIIKVVIMFLVQWGYALSAFITLTFLWYYMGAVNPGLFPGISEFRAYPWIKSRVLICFGKKVAEYDQMVVPTGAPNMHFQSDQLTKHNTDFSAREPYHQSSTSQYKTSNILTNN